MQQFPRSHKFCNFLNKKFFEVGESIPIPFPLSPPLFHFLSFLPFVIFAALPFEQLLSLEITLYCVERFLLINQKIHLCQNARFHFPLTKERVGEIYISIVYRLHTTFAFSDRQRQAQPRNIVRISHHIEQGITDLLLPNGKKKNEGGGNAGFSIFKLSYKRGKVNLILLHHPPLIMFNSFESRYTEV